MYLADYDEYRTKFELFITHPDDAELQKKLDKQFSALGINAEYTTFRVNERRGWAFFPEEVDECEEQLHPQVKKYLISRIMDLISHEIKVYNRIEQCSDIYEKPYEGIEVMKDVEVECTYFYDNVERYE